MKEIILSFFYVMLAELFLTFYAIYSSREKANIAGIFAALNTLLYCMNIQNVIINNYCIAASAFGAYIGTVLCIIINKHWNVK